MCIQPRKQALFSSFSLLLSISVSSFAVTLLPLAWSLPDQLRPELWIIFLTDTDLLESHSSPVYNLLLTFTWLPRLSTALFYIICISPSECFFTLARNNIFLSLCCIILITYCHYQPLETRQQIAVLWALWKKNKLSIAAPQQMNGFLCWKRGELLQIRGIFMSFHRNLLCDYKCAWLAAAPCSIFNMIFH